MRAHRVEAAVERGGTLVLDDLPFDEGEVVEGIVLSRADAARGSDLYPLRGKPVRYIAPTEPVADHG
ncbi:MAG: hypothetical protein H0U65_11240 [Rubrobacter sp.]|jgi:hypothetical protein|nr:hypothetical protein [Rubrobacter sp.]